MFETCVAEDPNGCARLPPATPTCYESRYLTLLAGGSPFAEIATSDFMFKMAAATSGGSAACSGGWLVVRLVDH